MTITGVAGNLCRYLPFYFIFECFYAQLWATIEQCGECSVPIAWWRHQMETFSALLAICAGNSPVTGEFHTQKPVTQSFDVFFDLRLNKHLSKQSRGWWFETPLHPLWRHFNGYYGWIVIAIYMVASLVNWLYDQLLRGRIQMALISLKAVLEGRHGDTLVVGNQ